MIYERCQLRIIGLRLWKKEKEKLKILLTVSIFSSSRVVCVRTLITQMHTHKSNSLLERGEFREIEILIIYFFITLAVFIHALVS